MSNSTIVICPPQIAEIDLLIAKRANLEHIIEVMQSWNQLNAQFVNFMLQLEQLNDDIFAISDSRTCDYEEQGVF